MSPVPVGMKMGRQDKIRSVFFQNRHKFSALERKAFFPCGASRVSKAVLERVLVHKNHFPLFIGGLQIIGQPFLFLGKQIGKPFAFFRFRRIQHGKVNISPVIGIIMPLMIFISVGGQLEMSQVPFRHGRFPIQGISLMISQDRRRRNLFDDILHRAEPGLPLVFILPVVHDVSQIHKERNIGIPAVCITEQLFPVRIIRTLRIGSNQRLEGFPVIGFQGIPGTHFIPAPCAVFIVGSFLQIRQAGCIQGAVGNPPISLKRLPVRLHRADFSAAFFPILQGIVSAFGQLPHDGTAGLIVRRCNLPDSKGPHGFLHCPGLLLRTAA